MICYDCKTQTEYDESELCLHCWNIRNSQDCDCRYEDCDH